MSEQALSAMGKPGVEDILLHSQADTAAYYGQMNRSRQLVQQAMASAEAAGAPERAAIYGSWLAVREVLVGNPERARKAASKAVTLTHGDFVASKVALALALAGDAPQAQALAEQVNRQLPLETMEQSYTLPTIHAAVEIGKNNPGNAIQLLQTVLVWDLGAGSLCCLSPPICAESLIST
jgi:hypothetical protein